MPLYEYECDGCGEFTAMKMMAESAEPAACPECGKDAERILSASFVAGGPRRRPPSAEPRLVRKVHDPERAAAKPKRSAPTPKPKVPHHHGRPWVVGH
ncbi:MAG: zinc ribbon domain-containing protein [Myxococcales bacterium]|nr:zinc ribbon domain-containing protein [Myxococcales bacterium]